MKHPCWRMNDLFLAMLLLYLGVSFGVSLLAERSMQIPVMAALVAGELILLVPCVLFLFLFHCDLGEWIPIRKVKIATVFLTVLLSFLIMPLLYFLNVVSQLVNENVALDLFLQTEDVSPLFLFFVIALLGPFCEEVVFRGILYHGFCRSGRIIASILWTALLFGLFHMNLNQLGYAFLIGVASALLVEGTGSLIPSLILHVVINGYNVGQIILVKVMQEVLGTDLSELVAEADAVDQDMMLRAAGVLLIPAVIFTALAAVVYVAILKQEGKILRMKGIFSGTKREETQEPKMHPVTLTGIIGVLICLFMIFLLPLLTESFGG